MPSSSDSSASSGVRNGPQPRADPSTRCRPSCLPLPFAELEALARPLLSVLLALLDARVARQESRLLQPLPQFDVVLDERPCDAEPEGAGLAGDAAAGDRREHVEFIGRFGDGQRLLDLGAERLGGEGLLDRLAIDDDAARAGAEEDAGGGCLAAARAVILNTCCHVMRPRACSTASAGSTAAASGPDAGARPPRIPSTCATWPRPAWSWAACRARLLPPCGPGSSGADPSPAPR